MTLGKESKKGQEMFNNDRGYLTGRQSDRARGTQSQTTTYQAGQVILGTLWEATGSSRDTLPSE